MGLIKKIVEIITNILMIIVIIAIFFALYGIVQLKVMNKTYINYFGYTFFEVVSGSMAPTINNYDLIIVKVDKDVKENDFITFYSDNTFITHRIIEYKDDQNILTKGDANNTSDKYISKDIVVGKVVHTIKEFGIIKRVISDPKMIISIFITIILFSVAFSIENKVVKNDEK